MVARRMRGPVTGIVPTLDGAADPLPDRVPARKVTAATASRRPHRAVTATLGRGRSVRVWTTSRLHGRFRFRADRFYWLGLSMGIGPGSGGSGGNGGSGGHGGSGGDGGSGRRATVRAC